MFNENLKILRKEKGYSQEQLAARLNVVRQTISKWEKGISVPDAELLVKLADTLEVEVSVLLGNKIEISEDAKENILAQELSKLNELLVVNMERNRLFRKKICAVLGVLIAIVVIGNDWIVNYFDIVGKALHDAFGCWKCGFHFF